MRKGWWANFVAWQRLEGNQIRLLVPALAALTALSPCARASPTTPSCFCNEKNENSDLFVGFSLRSCSFESISDAMETGGYTFYCSE